MSEYVACANSASRRRKRLRPRVTLNCLGTKRLIRGMQTGTCCLRCSYSHYTSHSHSILHHCNELLVVDLSIVIFVDSVEELIDLVLREGEVVTLKARSKFVLADRSVRISADVRIGGEILIS